MSKRADELSTSELEAEIEALARKLDRLRALYEQYFLGVEKRPPHTARKDIVRIVNRLTNAKIRNTALKFRLQQQVQKFSSMKAYWNRTEREIEDGTYRRHRQRVQNREKRRAATGTLTAAEVAAINAVRDQKGEEAAAAAREKRIAAKTEAGAAAEDFLRQLGVASKPAPAATSGEDRKPATEIPRGVSADELAKRAAKLRAMKAKLSRGGGAAPPAGERPARKPASRAERKPSDRDQQVYERLVATKRKLNESTSKLSADGLKKSLAKQRERVRKKHGCRDVEFDVVVKNGKAFLKPIPVD